MIPERLKITLNQKKCYAKYTLMKAMTAKLCKNFYQENNRFVFNVFNSWKLKPTIVPTFKIDDIFLLPGKFKLVLNISL